MDMTGLDLNGASGAAAAANGESEGSKVGQGSMTEVTLVLALLIFCANLTELCASQPGAGSKPVAAAAAAPATPVPCLLLTVS